MKRALPRSPLLFLRVMAMCLRTFLLVRCGSTLFVAGWVYACLRCQARSHCTPSLVMLAQVATVSLAGSCWQDLVVFLTRPSARIPMTVLSHLAGLVASVTYVVSTHGFPLHDR